MFSQFQIIYITNNEGNPFSSITASSNYPPFFLFPLCYTFLYHGMVIVKELYDFFECFIKKWLLGNWIFLTFAKHKVEILICFIFSPCKVSVCVCVCVRERERERERDWVMFFEFLPYNFYMVTGFFTNNW